MSLDICYLAELNKIKQIFKTKSEHIFFNRTVGPGFQTFHTTVEQRLLLWKTDFHTLRCSILICEVR